ncbi:MAG: hypothetical protein CBE43_04665 [Rhodopirellula sp. TMED283]|nr:MAG: hypothetical protein CBE43_04665 [Rhodopirellula sp. TMED283]
MENNLDWAFLLFMEIMQFEHRRLACNWRLMTALSMSALRPEPGTLPVVFKRSIDAWLHQQSDPN